METICLVILCVISLYCVTCFFVFLPVLYLEVGVPEARDQLSMDSQDYEGVLSKGGHV